ncbi:fimbrial protein [Burkholderia dolosa]|uniref:fimbrial protein n=1 Tax=Burkholderia dolosa TaxID=152500 RepID=UPI0015909354|nr:fimbrial protein [Burkholderia dolosa]MBR8058056.1 type 1 fimbrial protein [Burkholderia dolosa]MBR8299543.1 type 1 fimbrial protein [Burkholderia dolosa]MBR8456197.1 type 1 fimbrial protein [Burkholderia dolosa]MBY4752550.1 type 1 fimbrial protein [Burkholderia dolosa]MBY4832268.1 type 1 fimbrial protein [Burkholderia dolosa]
MNRILAALFSLICVIFPFDARALSCYIGKDKGPVTMVEKLPDDLYVLASMQQGGVIWESAAIRQRFYCWSRVNEPVSFWVNPRKLPVGEGVEVAIRYNGKLYRQSDGSIPTGFSVTEWYLTWYEKYFDLTYSLVLLRKGMAPATGQTQISNYSVFQLDGQQGINGNPNQNFNQLINGSIAFSRGTCDFRVGDDRKVVALPPTATNSLSAVGKTSGRTRFSIGMQKCDVGVSRVTFSFTGDADSDLPVAFRNTGTATGVGVRLAKADDDTALGANGVGNTATEPVNDGSVRLNLTAEYVGTNGRPSAGSVSALATVSISYE